MIVKFDGGEARQHHIEAFSGVESLGGITRAASLVAHYVAVGQVRYKRPFSSEIEFYLEGTEPGSLTFVLSSVGANAQRAAALTSSANKLLRRVIKRATGQAQSADLQLAARAVPAGDIDALAEAAEPGLRRAHSWIDTRGKSIRVDDGGDAHVTLNSATKTYIDTEIEAPQLDVQDVSVGALNANTRTGRVYFHDLGRTVPFKAPRDATNRTVPTLSRFLTEYAERTGATVNIKFRRIFYADNRLKRIIIYDCFPIGAAA